MTCKGNARLIAVRFLRWRRGERQKAKAQTCACTKGWAFGGWHLPTAHQSEIYRAYLALVMA